MKEIFLSIIVFLLFAIPLTIIFKKLEKRWFEPIERKWFERWFGKKDKK